MTAGLPDWTLTPVQRDDVDLLVTGGYAPLGGFLTHIEAASVREAGQLPDGTAWPTPVVLVVDADTAVAATDAGRLALRDDDHTLLAVLTVTDGWQHQGRHHLGGPVTSINPVSRWDFAELRRPMDTLRDELLSRGTPPLIVAQPTGVVDVRTAARWSRATAALVGDLLVLPAVGADPERVHVSRIRGYRQLLPHLPDGTRLRLLPSARSPSDAATALHAAVARNVGATHLLVDDPPLGARDDDGARDDGARDDESTACADLVASLGLILLEPDDYASPDDPPPGVLHDEVAAEVERADPPRSRRGFVLLLSGLSGSGKSTVAQVLRARLVEAGDRAVTLLDGDLVRRHLSRGLGFSRDDRDLNVRRIGYVASEIAKHGGIAICAPIAPYDTTRREARAMVEAAGGGLVLVHVATPLAICEARDVKGLYAKARAGELPGFTGIDDPYEQPTDAEVVVDTASASPVEVAEKIMHHLSVAGWYDPDH